MSTSPRRLGAEQSATRGRLLEAASLLLVEEGATAVTSRRLAARAGLKPQLVHYYFATMDDLFVALLEAGAAQSIARVVEAVASPEPLRALWEAMSDPAGSVVAIQMAALASHRPALRSKVAELAERVREHQVTALAGLLPARGAPSAEAAAVLMTCVGQVLGLEEALGVTRGHVQARQLVEDLIARQGTRSRRAVR